MSSIRVFLLGALAERGPMHGHQLRLLAEKEHVHMWTDFHVGGIYGALKRLLAEDLVEPVRTEREGARPERQIVRITEAGRRALDALRRCGPDEAAWSPTTRSVKRPTRCLYQTGRQFRSVPARFFTVT